MALDIWNSEKLKEISNAWDYDYEKEIEGLK